MSRQRIGELLVSAGVLTQEKLDSALAQPRAPGQRLGAYLVQNTLVSETQLTQILGQQLSVPWVSLYHIDFSRQLLNLVPREVAETYCLIPIYVRRVRKQGETLYVAMDDPTNEVALAEVAQHAGLPAQPMIAAPSDIRSAINVYYGTGEATTGAPPLVSTELAPIAPSRSSEPPVPPASPSRRPPAPKPTALPARAILSSDHPGAAPEIEATEIEIPRRLPRGMIAMTMLDGTKINLPAQRGGGGGGGGAGAGGSDDSSAPTETVAGAEMTARDLVRALRAVAHGKNPAELTHDLPKTEEIMAALLSLLMRKGLVADWEFIAELKKVRRRKSEETEAAAKDDEPKAAAKDENKDENTGT